MSKYAVLRVTAINARASCCRLLARPRLMKATLFSIALAAALSFASHVSGQGEAQHGPGPVSFIVKGQQIDMGLVDYVAEVGQEATYVLREASTAMEVIRRHCGRFDPLFWEYIAAQGILHSPDNPGSPPSPSTTLEAGRQVTLPACVRGPEFVPVERPYDGPSSPFAFYQEDPAGFGVLRGSGYGSATQSMQEYFSAFAALNPDLLGATHYVEASDERVFVPSSGEFWTSIPLQASVDRDRVLEEIATLLNETVDQGERFDVAEDDYELFTPVRVAGSGGASAGCGHAAKVNDQLSKLLTVIRRNLDALKSRNEAPSEVVVAVPDTGLHSSPAAVSVFNHFISERDLALIAGTASKEAFAPNSAQEPEVRQHGTYVSSLALGGANFVDVLRLADIPIKLVPINIFDEVSFECGMESYCARHPVRPDSYYNAMKGSSGRHVIMNLSIGRSTRISPLEGYLGMGGNILFVVASGNHGQSLSQRQVYPARYGGEHQGKDNLLTVAALDSAGNIAEYSNFGETYVDVGADGCSQDVLGFDAEEGVFKRATVEGTSIAAPQVTFAAALVESLWPSGTPREVKNRILVASDVRLSLGGRIRNGKALNVVKAVAVASDVVEKIDGELIIGSFRFDSPVVAVCGETLFVEPSSNGVRIRRVAYLESEGADRRVLLEVEDPDGHLISNECTTRTPDTWYIVDGLTGELKAVSAGEVRDVVFAERRF